MEWFGSGSPGFSREKDGESVGSNSLLSSPLCQQVGAASVESLCRSQQQCVKDSIVGSWQLAEAQDRLCGLELHGSESAEQERARAQASSAELFQTEREWRHKESLLGSEDRKSPVLCNTYSRDVFNKSIINVQNGNKEANDDLSQTFIQKYEHQLRHYGMLRRWDDSQRFLSDHTHLICEETANYLVLWCFRLSAEEKEALMEQVAHQAVAMQFILEMASTNKEDPRGCFRKFFQKAKEGQEGYVNIFTAELEAFKQRVREYTMKCKSETFTAPELQNTPTVSLLDPKEVLESLPPDLKRGFQLQDMQILQNVLGNMNPQVAEYYVKRCLDAGLWVSSANGTKGEATEDTRTMETS
ncbi:hsp90 co-chaperone Cdc37-like 1 [Lepisosteus oculatus]|uniref:Hsp90 co-chaperone Cdc37-like 1 n=1 Tax=Lepisosteus oculatus TaxID=7918 RepID=W5MZL3_LEPOC|nr:PREDICTED: hsp90 co-chaperone Cdc37-like 1 [Lepisosteus oculatus]